MDEIEGLDYLSPNERERYILEQRQSSRIERMIAARKQFSNFYKNRLDRFAQQKKQHEQKKKKIIEEEQKKKQRQLDHFRSRLTIAQQNMGDAHNNAITAMIEEQENIAQEKIDKIEQKKKANQRFNEAMEIVKANDPRLPLQERANQMNAARSAADKRTAAKIEKYNQMLQQQKEEERAARKALKEQEKEKLYPKINPSDFANTHFHAGIGLIPVNHEAVKYDEEIKKNEVDEEALKKKREVEAKKRAKKAAFRHQIEKDTANLAKELQQIHQTEVDEHLDAIKKHPQRELIAGTTYNLDDRDAKMQARIQRFLAFNDDAPKPRGPAPQPQPLHMMTTSPMQSSDDDDDDVVGL